MAPRTYLSKKRRSRNPLFAPAMLGALGFGKADIILTVFALLPAPVSIPWGDGACHFAEPCSSGDMAREVAEQMAHTDSGVQKYVVCWSSADSPCWRYVLLFTVDEGWQGGHQLIHAQRIAIVRLPICPLSPPSPRFGGASTSRSIRRASMVGRTAPWGWIGRVVRGIMKTEPKWTTHRLNPQ
ncbi:hypothetical protein DENSPDRAFT_693645 [Dentipellis sp. KUC8613]|nr:hypothetical protein DENSPDRAFT_693645 [Dentipellis sp. KUC8613]